MIDCVDSLRTDKTVVTKATRAVVKLAEIWNSKTEEAGMLKSL